MLVMIHHNEAGQIFSVKIISTLGKISPFSEETAKLEGSEYNAQISHYCYIVKRNCRELGSEKLVVLRPGEKDTRGQVDLLDQAVPKSS